MLASTIRGTNPRTASKPGQVGQRHRPVPLGQPLPVLVEGQRHVCVLDRRQADQRRQVRLPRRRGEQVVAADHLVDILRVVVHHHREVVGGHPVVAAQYQVVPLR